LSYSGTIADDATDPDVGDTLSFSKLSGPAWLTVTSDGTLSGTPATADLGLGTWTVQVSDGNGGIDQATLNITIKAPQPEYFYANQDIPVQNRGITGSYPDTHYSDDNYEGITERESGGKKSKRHSYLEHKWIIPVTGGLQSYVFNIEAYHASNTERDDFELAYSTNDLDYVDMVTVTKMIDDNAVQTFALPESISGSIYIRVTDTDQSSGNRNRDTIYINHMYILGGDTPPPNSPPEKPSVPDPADGATGVETNPELSVYAYDPDGDDMDISFYLNNEEIGIVPDVTSGFTASFTLSGLDYNTSYSWYTTAYDGEYLNKSDTWTFTTGSETHPGGMYVWDIGWASAGKNLKSDVTIRWDSDGDGTPESSDEPVIGATVYYTLTHQQTGDSISYIETTDANGQVSIQWKKAPEGVYEGLVTDITHSIYTYTPEIDSDNPDYYTF